MFRILFTQEKSGDLEILDEGPGTVILNDCNKIKDLQT